MMTVDASSLQSVYWKMATPKPDFTPQSALPKQADYVIVGSGLTGMVCALYLARAKKNVVVLDKELNFGCSSRSGGMLGSGNRLTYSNLKILLGAERARDVIVELNQTLQFIKNFIRDENIDGDYTPTGRFIGVFSNADLEDTKQFVHGYHEITGEEYITVDDKDVQDYLYSHIYKGAIIRPEHAMVNPAKLSMEVSQLCHRAGVHFITPCTVQSIDSKTKTQKIVHTDRGSIQADTVIACTNGYTHFHKNYDVGFASRLMPMHIGSIVTQELPTDVIQKLMPHNQAYIENHIQGSYFRQTPCGKRIFFGGRHTLVDSPAGPYQTALEGRLRAIFADTGVPSDAFDGEYFWEGKVAMSLAQVAFIQKATEGYYRIGGYSGSGMATAPYLGWRMSQILLGTDESSTVFAKVPSYIMPHLGDGWFAHVISAYYRLRDRLEA